MDGGRAVTDLMFPIAGMSEDSDYTSDIYPSHHQNNMSAHQIPRERQYDRSVPQVNADFEGWEEERYNATDPSYEDGTYSEQHTPTTSDMRDVHTSFNELDPPNRCAFIYIAYLLIVHVIHACNILTTF